MKTKTKIIARYAETDKMGIIHHSVYPVWYEAARTEYVKQFGISYSEMEKKGVMMPLTALTCRYVSPAYYEDEIIIETLPVKLSPARIIFAYTALRASSGAVIGSATTEHGFVSSETFRPINVKKSLPRLYSQISEDVLTAASGEIKP